MTFWQRADLFPPILVRLLARHRFGRPLTDDEISQASDGKLSPWQIHILSRANDWANISHETMRLFLQACGVDFCDPKQMKRVDAYIRKPGGPKWSYLRKDPAWVEFYQPMIIAWKRSKGL